ncbi:amyloid-beta A4 precursor protein-binding family A member 1 isoform X2 [Trichomycterus rosablanca]|uniref:amyloid-beta A4 precursor protein-binding family A member 1 isoform X2 n=1 Tax=Trichomycterus rosablanca TaxID=2290929 RepID=UPI002F35E6C2
MSHREEPEGAGTKAPAPQNSQQPNSTLAEGGRPRWRPCQLNSQDEQENVHHHHHHHYHRQSQQPGANRAPPRRSRRHAPSQAQRKVNESEDAEPQPSQQPRPGVTRYRRSGERGHQHRHRQQPKHAHEIKELQLPGSDPDVDVLSNEESSITPSSQDDLTPSQEELTPSPQEIPHKEEQAGGSPGLQCSSSTESSLQAHSEQTEHLQEQNEQMEHCKDGREEPMAEGCQEKEETVNEEECQGENNCLATVGSSKGSLHHYSKRSGPIRVDVPPFAEIPRQPILIPHFQAQSFSDPPSSSPKEHKSGPNHFNLNDTTPMSTETTPECPQSFEETFSDSSTEACSDSYPQNCENHSKFYPVTQTESDRELYQLHRPEWYKEHTDNQYFNGARPQMNPQEEPRQCISVGSRLHHYDEQSGDEAGSPKRRNRQPWKHMSSKSLDEDSPELKKEPAESGLPVLNNKGEVEHDAIEDKPYALQDSANISGDAISLAIRNIKEAIEEVKTKTVRSPYKPDKPNEPVWVMRRDISPVEECHPQFYSTSPRHSSSQKLAPVPDPKPPAGAESSRTQDADVSPSLPLAEEMKRNLAAFPTYVDVPGPCDPEDLIDGIIFAASYLGFTQLLSERTPSKSARMQQAQEAMNQVRGAEGEALSATEVDLFVSTQRIKVLNAETQDTMMDHPLRTISYIADIGNMVVLMARRKMIRSHSAQEQQDTADTQHTDEHVQYRMICHVFESEDAQLIAQSIGQAFSVAYQEFLRANGIDPEDLSQREYSDLLNTQDMYNDDLVHFSKSENCKDVYIEKQKGEILGVVIVESGWGSILPTVIIASLMPAGPAAKSGCLNIGDQIMTVNGTSLVGLPLSTCQSIIKGLKSQSRIKMNIVRCPPVTMVLIRRPDLRYQLGFSVQNGIICSLMRGGIAERGGIRVGHRIIEISGQSVVATPHEKIVHLLSNAVGEIHMKTMPAAMYRLLTAQEQPVYI